MVFRAPRSPDPSSAWSPEPRTGDPDVIVLSFQDGTGRPDVQPNVALRRSLRELFGEPVGAMAADAPIVNGRRLAVGGRAGQPLDQRRSAGCREEIQVTLVGHPVDAASCIAERGLLTDWSHRDPRRRLSVDVSAGRAAHRQLAWDVTVQTVPFRHRRAILRLYGSPSDNITVLTLTPVTPRRLGVASFVHHGLAAMCALRDDIEAALRDRSPTMALG